MKIVSLVIPIFFIVIYFTSCVSVEKLTQQGNLKEAESYCNKQKAAKQPECFACIADTYFQNKKYKKAAELYIKSNKKETGIKNIANVYIKSNKFETAYKYYVYGNLGKMGAKKIAALYYKEGNFKKAYYYYTKAGEKIKAGKKIAHNYLANNEIDLAYHYFKQANMERKGAAIIGLQFINQNNYSTALKWYKKAGTINNGYSNVADKIFQNKQFDIAALLYKSLNDSLNYKKCIGEIIEQLCTVNNGQVIDTCLPINGALLCRSFTILSNNKNYQPQLKGIFSNTQFVLNPKQNTINKFLFSYIDNSLYTAISDNIIASNLFNEYEPLTFKGHTSAITDLLTFNNFLITSSWDETIRIWNKRTKSSRTLSSHKAVVTGIAMQEKEKKLISGSWDNTIKIWDIESGNCKKTLISDSPVIDVVSADSIIYSISKSEFLYKWGINNKHEAKLSGHKSWVNALELSKNNKYLITGDCDGTILIWDAQTSKIIRSFKAHESSITSISIDENAIYFITVGIDNLIKFWWLIDKTEAISLLGKL